MREEFCCHQSGLSVCDSSDQQVMSVKEKVNLCCPKGFVLPCRHMKKLVRMHWKVSFSDSILKLSVLHRLETVFLNLALHFTV